MPRRRRYLESNSVYEICFRARKTLPLSAHECVKLIIQCVLARTQRDKKVTICHDIWNGSHPHLLVVSQDAVQLLNFCSEVQKRITDIYKRLLGLDYLNIWEGTPSIIKIGDLAAAKERIAYLYANPAQNNLEDSIELFPGANSWRDYQQCTSKLEAQVSRNYPWIRLPTVPKAPSRVLSWVQDSFLALQIQASNSKYFELVRQPNAWMKCFGVREDSEVSMINAEIEHRLREKEENARKLRRQQGKGVLGRAALLKQPLLMSHEPKKRERKIFIITQIEDIRVAFIDRVKMFCAKCRECLIQWRSGNYDVKWPPEAFLPPLPPRLNLLAT